MALKGAPDADSAGAEGAIFAEINITPLTDIFLVLLIIFMVTSSVMSQLGVDVNLPSASSATSQAQPEGLVVTLLPAGALRVNDTSVSSGDYVAFESVLRETFKKMKTRLVILEGDKQALLGSAIEVMDHARKAGADKFAIATAPDQGR
ncbi:biopolymer transporter ExbD [Bdellovibrionota bacterium FG-2]